MKTLTKLSVTFRTCFLFYAQKFCYFQILYVPVKIYIWVLVFMYKEEQKYK